MRHESKWDRLPACHRPLRRGVPPGRRPDGKPSPGRLGHVGLLLWIGLIHSASAAPPIGILRLASGDRVTGTLQSIDSGAVAWRHPGFETAFTWSQQAASSIAFPSSGDERIPGGSWIIELTNDDFLYGDVVSLGREFVTIDSLFGRIDLPRSILRSAERIDRNEFMAFSGPGELGDWRAPSFQSTPPPPQAGPFAAAPEEPTRHPHNDPADWSMMPGGASTDVPGASLCHFMVLPDQFRLAATLSWEGTPNFELGWGYLLSIEKMRRSRPRTESPLEMTQHPPMRLEIFEDQFVAIWETGEGANLVPLANWRDLGGELSVEIDVDRPAGEAKFRVLGGETATLSLRGDHGKSAALHLINIEGNVSLRAITLQRTGSWIDRDDAADPRDRMRMRSGETRRIQRPVATAEVTEMIEGRADSAEPDVDLDIDLDIDLDEVEQISFAAAEPTAEPAARLSDSWRVIFHDGSRLQGSSLRVDDGQVNLSSVQDQPPLSVPLTEIARILLPAGNPVRPDKADGRLESGETRIAGRFVDATGEDGSPLRFQPAGATAATISHELVGRYIGAKSLDAPRDDRGLLRPPEVKAQPRRQRRPGGLGEFFSRAFLRSGGVPPPAAARQIIHLRDGDAFAGRVTSITDSHVGIVSDWTSADRLPADAVATLQLAPPSPGVKLDAELDTVLKERLLTVPRQQRKSPPTHLVIAQNGDLLRCKVLDLDDQTLNVQTRLETLQIPRDVVSQILRLPSPQDDAATAAQDADGTVQVVLRDRTILRLRPTAVAGGVLRGTHRLLGSCELQLAEVDVMLIHEALSLPPPTIDWPLRNAPEPVEPPAAGGDNSIAAVASPLVGQPAPPIKLDLTDGKPFNVEEHRGHVLVLDFWASWCGPCLRAMPLIDEAVATFDPGVVQLVAVNLQEDAATIDATLERLGLSVDVAMDIDGVAAGRYQADAIPQTVVIDPDGKVTHVFVGAAADIGERLRAAIEQAQNP